MNLSRQPGSPPLLLTPLHTVPLLRLLLRPWQAQGGHNLLPSSPVNEILSNPRFWWRAPDERCDGAVRFASRASVRAAKGAAKASLAGPHPSPGQARALAVPCRGSCGSWHARGGKSGLEQPSTPGPSPAAPGWGPIASAASSHSTLPTPMPGTTTCFPEGSDLRCPRHWQMQLLPERPPHSPSTQLMPALLPAQAGNPS